MCHAKQCRSVGQCGACIVGARIDGWKGKGESGNAGGRPKVKEKLAAKIRTFTPELVDRLRAIALGQGTPPLIPGESVKAIGLLLAYGAGKPTEHVEVSGVDGGPLHMETDYPGFNPGELRMRLEVLKAEAEGRRPDEAAR